MFFRLTMAASLVAALSACSDSNNAGTNGSGGAAANGNGNGSGTGGDGVGGGASGSGAGGGDPSGGASNGGSGNGGAASGGAGGVDVGTPTGHQACALTTPLKDIGAPWSSADDAGPESHDTKYGARPRLPVAVRAAGTFLLGWQTADKTDSSYLTQVSKRSGTWKAEWTLKVPSLGAIAGVSHAVNGDPLLVSASTESIQGDPTPVGAHRDSILQLVRVGPDCKEVYRTQLRADFDGNTKRLPIYSPMTAGTGRLAVSGDRWLLHYSQNTEYDDGVKSRHQIGRYLTGSVETGTIAAELGDISHSFDQRIVATPAGFASLSLGDASFRGIQASFIDLAGKRIGRALFAVKGGDSATGGGYNNTFTRLGAVVPVSDGYVAVFASERSTSTAETVNDSRNLWLAHYPTNFTAGEDASQYEVSITDTKSQNAAAQDWDVAIKDYWGDSFSGANRQLVSVTNYTDAVTQHVERPRAVLLADGTILLAWELWSTTAYTSTWAARVDRFGNVQTAPKSLGTLRIPRGDDAFPIDGGLGVVESTSGKLVLHVVSAELALTTVEL